MNSDHQSTRLHPLALVASIMSTLTPRLRELFSKRCIFTCEQAYVFIQKRLHMNSINLSQDDCGDEAELLKLQVELHRVLAPELRRELDALACRPSIMEKHHLGILPPSDRRHHPPPPDEAGGAATSRDAQKEGGES